MEFIFIPLRFPRKIMCIYKITFDNGYYYIGGTVDLGGRLTKHKSYIKNGVYPPIIQDAIHSCLTANIEVLEVINDRIKLKYREDFYIKRFFGLPLCLNTRDTSSLTSRKRSSKEIIIQFNERGREVRRYRSIAEAAQISGISYGSIAANLQGKSKAVSGAFYFRRVSNSGEVLHQELLVKRTAKHAQAVIKYDSNGNEVGIFRTIAEAATEVGIDRGSIRNSLYGERKSLVKGLYYYKFPDLREPVRTE